MRLYLYIILSLISFNGFCQTNPLNDSIDKKGDYITELATMKFLYPIVFPNSFYVNPNIDSLNLVTLVGGSFYWHNGSMWTLISGGGGGGSYFAAYGLNLTGFTFSLDTTKAVTQTRLNNELSNITTLGIISTGIWQGTAIADAYIASASNWNEKQSAITFSNGVKNIAGSVTLDYTYAGVFTNTTWNGVPIGNSYLANSDISINGLSISLGGSGNISDANLAISDVVTNNSSTSQHGFIKKLNGISTYYMGGDGNWSIPSTTGTSLPNGDIWIGNSSSIATTVAMSGDATINNLGVLSLKNTGTAGTNGTSTSIPVFVTDAQGRVTSNTNTAIGTLNQNTTGSAATLATARLLGGNSFNGSSNVPFANNFIVQGTSDAGLTGAQFLGSLGTGIMKNTTTTGFVSIASAGTDYESPIIFSTGLTRVVNTVSVANTAVSAGSYTYGGFTVNAQGQLTSASSGTPPVTSVTGTSLQIAVTSGTTPTISLPTSGTLPGSWNIIGTNITGTASAFTAGTVTTNANQTGPVTSSGNVTSISNSINLPGSPTTTTQTAGENTTIIATDQFVGTAIANAINGTDYKAEAIVATTSALATNIYNNGSSGVGATLTGVSTGALTIDGHTVGINDRVLIKNEVANANNGIYICTTAGALGVAYILTRSSDFNSTTNIAGGDALFISSGSTLSVTTWVMTTAGTITVGTTAISFAQIGGSGGGSGTVTSVAVTVPTDLSLSGSPITTSGTFVITHATLNTITDATNFVYNGNNGSVQKITLGASRTFTITNLLQGVQYFFEVIQDATGGRLLTWPTVKVAYGGAGAPPQSTAANAIDKYTLTYDGTSIFVDYSLNNN